MFKKGIIIVTIAVAAVVLFTACERSASQPMLATSTAGSPNASSSPTVLSYVQQHVTESAVYAQTEQALGLLTPIPASGTPEAGGTPTQAVASATTLPATAVPATTSVPGTTPTAVPVVVPAATPGRPASYTLHAGEFVYCLARRFNVDPTDLISLNGLASGQVLQPGMTLQIPQTGSFPGQRMLASHPTQYTVAVNDTIYIIACHFGDVDPSAIAAANNISLTTPLATGQTLTIP